MASILHHLKKFEPNLNEFVSYRIKASTNYERNESIGRLKKDKKRRLVDKIHSA